MGSCIHHPDRETGYYCMKHQEYRCEECLRCKDPALYCKFRTSCPIWFMQKAGDSLDEAETETPEEEISGK